MSDVLYLKIAQNVEVKSMDVYLGDVAKMECTKSEILNKVKTIKLLTIPDKKHNRYVMSILKVIELIHKVCPQVEVQNLGEIDFVIDYEEEKRENPYSEWGKVAFVCLITFFGAVFSIMTFHNDVGVVTVFDELYNRVLGQEASGYTILEITYTVGLVLGIMVFYNHFGAKKVNRDPTPVEVEMRLYEDNINTTLVEGVNRQEMHIEVK